MFENLGNRSSDEVTGAVYYALRLISNRNWVNLQEGFIIPNVASEPSPQDQELALEIIDEIQRKENKSLKDLESRRAEEYVIELSDLVMGRIRQKKGFDEKRGRRLLQEMKESSSLARLG